MGPKSSSLREALLRFGKEQGRRGAVLADGSVGPACTPFLCLPPCESVSGLDTLTAGHIGNAVFSSWPSGSPQGSLSSGCHWPAIDFSSGLTRGLFFIFIPCVQRWLTRSSRGLGNKRSKGASILKLEGIQGSSLLSLCLLTALHLRGAAFKKVTLHRLVRS